VDNRNKKGQFLLCGSSVPDFDSKRHSGAMRIGRITMSTMSLEEMGISSCEVNFFDLINGVCINGAKEVLKSELIDVILKGGWPNNLYLTSYESMIATKNYITNIASVDLRSLTDRPSQERTIALIKALSRNITTSVSYETLARESQIIESPVSIRKYLDFLIRIFLIEELPV
jgi:predicted AAA+ superfamily ATPase